MGVGSRKRLGEVPSRQSRAIPLRAHGELGQQGFREDHTPTNRIAVRRCGGIRMAFSRQGYRTRNTLMARVLDPFLPHISLPSMLPRAVAHPGCRAHRGPSIAIQSWPATPWDCIAAPLAQILAARLSALDAVVFGRHGRHGRAPSICRQPPLES